MKQKTRDKVIAVFFGIILFGIMMAIITLILSSVDYTAIEENQRVTNIKCCGGENNYCTDVYFDKKDNKCHSTFMVIELFNGNISFWTFIPQVVIISSVAIILTLIIRFLPKGYLKKNKM